jgi:aldehyde dehydrogenase (NAD+)
MLEKRDFYINGAWVSPAKANDFAVIDPSTEEQCAVISLGGQADTDAAVSAARAAFDSWSQTSREERMALLEKLAAVYDARQEEMAQAMSMEMGAPIELSRAQQVGAGSWHIGGFLKAFKDFSFEKDFTATEKTLLEPIGVCALITPWNWPMNQIILKAIPAIATGCTVILKPSEVAPLSGHLFAEFMHEAGFPAGVFNMLNGDGPGVGSQLSSHPDVDMVSFTGSPARASRSPRPRRTRSSGFRLNWAARARISSLPMRTPRQPSRARSAVSATPASPVTHRHGCWCTNHVTTKR